MEENNRKGPGVFYAVVGVATLVVAIIGATFAYFSAQASTGENDIKGSTLDLSGTALKMKAEKLDFTGAQVTNKNLVPATMTNDIAGVNAALAAKCENSGYTGCHVYRITAGSTETVTAATVTLDLQLNGVTVKEDWKYALFTATDAAIDATTTTLTDAVALTTVETGKAFGTIGEGVNLDLNFAETGKSLGLTGGTDKVVYLMVYLENDATNAQNNPEDTGNLATGSYTGTVTLNAGADGGKVSATFTA